jgi:addiction module HigA family antidote
MKITQDVCDHAASKEILLSTRKLKRLQGAGWKVGTAKDFLGLSRGETARMAKLKLIHPGEILLEEFLKPSNFSQNALARAIGVPPRRINEIVLGKRGITADTAIRLAKHFATSEQFWMGLQADYDLEEARRGMKLVA